MAKQNPPVGSTRKQMTTEEREWLSNFNKWWKYRDQAALKKICPDADKLADIKKRDEDRINSQQRDIFYKCEWMSLEELRSAYGDSDGFTSDPVSLKPLGTKARARYTPEDYNKPGVPDEDGLIDLLDAEKEQK